MSAISLPLIGYVKSVRELILEKIKGENIAENLRLITAEPHVAGTEANARVADKIAALWRKNGLESAFSKSPGAMITRLLVDVHFVNYDVLLSYPDYQNPNHVSVVATDGSEQFKTVGVSPVVIAAEQGAPGKENISIAYVNENI